MEARNKTLLIKSVSPAQAPAATVFLVSQGHDKNDRVHTGIVIAGNAAKPGNVFSTIEGNTHDEGSRGGFEVCERFRSWSKVGVVLLEPHRGLIA